MRINQRNVIFVLTEPKHSGNIGAAARAIKTMGFRNLYLVKPHDADAPEARWMAHASEDVLDSARIFPSLQEALKDVHFAVATTQRDRELHFPFYTPEELAQKIIAITQEHTVAIVFGREDSGLTNEEIRQCHAVSTIPAAVKYPSLNLSQAVMIYSYEFFKNSYAEERKYHWRLANQEQIQALLKHLQTSLKKAEFKPIDSWENFLMRFMRFFGRANPEVRDVRVMHLILQAFEFYIEKLEREINSLQRGKK